MEGTIKNKQEPEKMPKHLCEGIRLLSQPLGFWEGSKIKRNGGVEKAHISMSD